MKLKNLGIIVGIVLLVFGFSAQHAQAQRLLGTLNTGTDSSPATSTLVELDPATGNLLATIGDVGYAVNGMAYDATTGNLYATTTTWDPVFPGGLIIINPATAAATPVGSGSGQDVNVPAVNAAGQLFGWTESGDDPVLWNKVAGTISVIGDSGIATRLEGLDFDNTGTLYLVQDYDWNQDGQSVYTINTTTGAATAVGALTTLPNGYAHHGKFHPVTNLYYGIDGTLGRTGTITRNLLVINVSTLTLVNTIPTVDYLHTLVFLPGTFQANPIPTLGTWGLGLLILVLGAVGFMVIRSRFV